MRRGLLATAVLVVVSVVYAHDAYAPLPSFNRSRAFSTTYVDADDQQWAVEWLPEPESVLGLGYWYAWRGRDKAPRLPTMTVTAKDRLRASWRALQVYMDECP